MLLIRTISKQFHTTHTSKSIQQPAQFVNCRCHLIIGVTFDDKWVIFACLTEQYMTLEMAYFSIIIVNIIIFCYLGKKQYSLWHYLTATTLLLYVVCWTHITCPSCKLISVAVPTTARQLTLEEQIQCHGLKDKGHSLAEYHDPVFMFVYITNEFRDMHEKMEWLVILLCERLALKLLVTLSKNCGWWIL